MVRVHATKMSDLEDIRLHPCNVEEIESLCSYSPAGALRQLVLWTMPYSYTVRDDDRVLCFCGLDNKNEMWLFFTDVEKLPVSFFKEVGKLYESLKKNHPLIYGMIYEKNVFALRFAKFMKAKIYDPVPFGERGDLFYKFEIGG